MPNPTDSSRTPTTRTGRLRALRPSRPVVMVAGLAALASATGVGIASGNAGDADFKHPAAVADGATDQALADRANDVAARGTERAALDIPTPASSPASQALAAQQSRQAQAKLAAQAEADRKAADQAAAAASSSSAAPAPDSGPAASGSGYVRPVPGAGHGSYGRSGSLWSHGHTGEDFSAGAGTPVKAVTSGTVVKTGWGGAYGNEVVIKHADGKYTQYGHLSKFSVSAGQAVSVGQQIGLVGSTGNSTGPHLHFEVRTGPNYGSDIDPIAYLRSKGVGV